MPIASHRIVVQIAPEDKRKITEKARVLKIPLSELMRRGAFAYSTMADDVDLGALADAAKQAADNASLAIDDVVAFVKQSNLRIAAIEANRDTMESVQ